MKLASFRRPDGLSSVGVVREERLLDIGDWVQGLAPSSDSLAWQRESGALLAAGGMLRLLQSGPAALDALRGQVDGQLPWPSYRLDEVALLAPVPRPGKIVAVGRNYADHAKETGVQPFEKPRIIFKLPSSVAAPGSAVPRPAGVEKLDFEVELAVVIGGFGRRVTRADALGLVAGYSVLDDVSAREFQFDVNPAQTTFAKSMDRFAPMGPWMVSADEIPDPQCLDVSLQLNGEEMQHANTRDMLFPVAALIEYVTQFMTLEPGDVLATGTPAGIGAFRKPPLWLKPGDRLRLEVERVGVLEHSIA